MLIEPMPVYQYVVFTIYFVLLIFMFVVTYKLYVKLKLLPENNVNQLIDGWIKPYRCTIV